MCGKTIDSVIKLVKVASQFKCCELLILLDVSKVGDKHLKVNSAENTALSNIINDIFNIKIWQYSWMSKGYNVT